jgi:hypothetical protein
MTETVPAKKKIKTVSTPKNKILLYHSEEPQLKLLW